MRKGRPLGLGGLREVATLVTPETILAWHRKLIALKYGAKQGMTRLSKKKAEVRALIIIRISIENPSWGYRRTKPSYPLTLPNRDPLRSKAELILHHGALSIKITHFDRQVTVPPIPDAQRLLCIKLIDFDKQLDLCIIYE